jgi:hypothetical protein
MKYLSVSASAYGYRIRRSGNQPYSDTPVLIAETLGLAEQCELYPDIGLDSIHISFGAERKQLEQFCVLAQLSDIHLEIKDFDSVHNRDP